MLESPISLADLSINKYAAAMRELANGLGGWSGFLLPLFYLYQIFVTESAQFFSWKTLILVVVGELLFVLLWKGSNLLVAFVAALLIMPMMNSGKVVTAQNIQNTWMAVFGLLVCARTRKGVGSLFLTEGGRVGKTFACLAALALLRGTSRIMF